MRPSFHPRLVNDPFGDPGIFVPFIFEKQALLFDLGDLAPLTPREILRTGRILVSHTHMDHFIGFDRLLRLLLGRDKHLHLYGPAGILDNVEGKLNGYCWNLVDSYDHPFVLTVHELNQNRVFSKDYRCGDRFRSEHPPERSSLSGPLIRESGYQVTAAILDHGIPCLGFRLEETFHVNILKDRLTAMGVSVGPWLNRFKQALLAGPPGGTEFEIPPECCAGGPRRFALAELMDRIARITPGQKVTYITDTVFSAENP